MLITRAALFLLIPCCITLQGQDNVPAALEKRLNTFTDQLWLSWMKTGDIRSVSAVRVQEMLSDAPCGFITFTTQDACEQLSKDERVDNLQTTENIMTLVLYRVLSHEDLDKDKVARFGPDVISRFLSAPELSLLIEVSGKAKTVDDFRKRVSRYKELEKMLQAAHVKDFERTQNTYAKNVARLDQGLQNIPTISRVDPTFLKDLTAGEYFAVRKGLSIFWLQMSNEQLKFLFVQPVTQ